MAKEAPYDANFYASHDARSRASAARIAPMLVRALRPQSVLDLGCGTGTWLAEFVALGVPDVLGVDGDYVASGSLKISQDRFLPHDLAKPLALGRKFDLALSLEVAEHLDARVAEEFVACLARHSDLVCFSAAVPGQIGTHHVNCQPLSYWRRIFSAHGYALRDCIRGNVWEDPGVEWWYAQNTVLFARGGALGEESEREIAALERKRPLDIVHPALLGICEGGRREATEVISEVNRRPLRNLAKRMVPDSARRVIRGIRARRVK